MIFASASGGDIVLWVVLAVVVLIVLGTFARTVRLVQQGTGDVVQRVGGQ